MEVNDQNQNQNQNHIYWPSTFSRRVMFAYYLNIKKQCLLVCEGVFVCVSVYV